MVQLSKLGVVCEDFVNLALENFQRPDVDRLTLSKLHSFAELRKASILEDYIVLRFNMSNVEVVRLSFYKAAQEQFCTIEDKWYICSTPDTYIDINDRKLTKKGLLFEVFTAKDIG